MRAMVRIKAEIDDTVEVDVDDDASDDEIIKAAHDDWSFVEASSWSEEILERKV